MTGTMKKRIAAMTAALWVAAGGAFGLEFKGTAPQVDGNELNAALTAAFNNMLNALNTDAARKAGVPEEFITAFGNSSVYTSSGAAQRGYDPMFLAVTAGTMFGGQIGGSPFEVVSKLEDVETTLQKAGDLNLGFDPRIVNVQGTLNLNALVKNLSVGVRAGFTPAIEFGGFSYETLTVGALANYRILPPVDLLLVKWNGLTASGGIVFQRASVSGKANLGLDDSKDITSNNTTVGTLSYDPSLSLSLTTSTYTIPLEVTTAIRLVFFNVTAGLGADIAFGSSDLTIGVESPLTVEFNDSSVTTTPGSLEVEGSGSVSPTTFNPKIMAGLGFCFGPAIIDIPLTFYPVTGGFSVGLTVGAVL